MLAMTKERRRSERIWLTIPVRGKGIDADFRDFEFEGRGVTLSRHGARIQSHRPLETGQTVHLKSPLGKLELEFRIVHAVVSREEDGGQYGLERLNENENFWGIQFPSVKDSMNADAIALLECRICHALALLPLTFLEVQTLRTIGVLGKTCQACAAICPWRYAELRVPMKRGFKTAAASSADPRPQRFAFQAKQFDRGHRRALVQLPLGIRDSHGQVEVTKTENISRCGFCFVSEKRFLKDEIIKVVCPLDEVTQDFELAARIVRDEPVEGAERRIYGATFEPRNCAASVAA